MKIGIIDSLHNSYVDQPDIEQRVLGGDASVTLYRVRSTDELPPDALECDGLISWHLVPLQAGFLGELKACRGIVRAAVGFDNIDSGGPLGRQVSPWPMCRTMVPKRWPIML